MSSLADYPKVDVSSSPGKEDRQLSITTHESSINSLSDHNEVFLDEDKPQDDEIEKAMHNDPGVPRILSSSAPGLLQSSISLNVNEESDASFQEPLVDADPYREADKVREKVEHFFSGSTFTFPDGDFPTFAKNELVIGNLLGEGGFSKVAEIPMIKCVENQCSKKLSRRDSVALNNNESRHFIAEHCVRESGDARYAIKNLRPEVIRDPDLFWIGVTDLVTETRFLFHLEHPNIIKVRGVADADPFSRNYFLVLDRLYSTLQERLQAWKHRSKKNKTLYGRLFRSNDRKELMQERLAAACDLSAALKYLHDRKIRICHRDLKPANIGFDIRGDIKVFDFGMARDLTVSTLEKTGDGLFHLTKMTGSLRYMSPENGLGQPYNEKCDVYSFSILLWEMLSLERPYKEFRDEVSFVKDVFIRGRRPPLRKKMSERCKAVMEGGWDSNVKKRLSISTIHNELRNELQSHLGMEVQGDYQRRRSTFVYDSTTERLKRGREPLVSEEVLDRSNHSSATT